MKIDKYENNSFISDGWMDGWEQKLVYGTATGS